MKKILTYFTVLLIILSSSCKNDYISWDSSKTFVGFVASSINVPETTANDVSLMIAGLENGKAATVNYEISTTGLTNPAILGTDFTLSTNGSVAFPTGAGYGKITVTPVDNANFTGDKSFYIVITTNSENYPNGKASKILVVIKDDEHPLAKWIGSYTIEAASYGDPGNWDETWTATTAPKDNDVTKLLITGIKGLGGTLEATIDQEEMTITLVGGQALGQFSSYGNIGIYLGTDDGTDTMDGNLVGTISADGSINIDLFGLLIDSGAYEGYLYDVFNTTWTKQ
jgi:hypothetical protein